LCYFDEVARDVVLQSASLLTCVAPDYLGGGYAAFQLGTASGSYGSISSQFLFYNIANLKASPPSVSLVTNAPITVSITGAYTRTLGSTFGMRFEDTLYQPSTRLQLLSVAAVAPSAGDDSSWTGVITAYSILRPVTGTLQVAPNGQDYTSFVPLSIQVGWVQINVTLGAADCNTFAIDTRQQSQTERLSQALSIDVYRIDAVGWVCEPTGAAVANPWRMYPAPSSDASLSLASYVMTGAGVTIVYRIYDAPPTTRGGVASSTALIWDQKPSVEAKLKASGEYLARAPVTSVVFATPDQTGPFIASGGSQVQAADPNTQPGGGNGGSSPGGAAGGGGSSAAFMVGAAVGGIALAAMSVLTVVGVRRYRRRAQQRVVFGRLGDDLPSYNEETIIYV